MMITIMLNYENNNYDNSQSIKQTKALTEWFSFSIALWF